MGSRDRSDQGRGEEVYVWEGEVGMCWGGVGMCGDGVGMCGADPGAHEPRGGVTWAPETGQTREGRGSMWGLVGIGGAGGTELPWCKK